jgi:hypothetical protein
MRYTGIILDLVLRFLFGGAAVAGCYILLLIVPWKSFAGIFAAFPAVLASAVIMTGYLEGRQAAAQLAMGDDIANSSDGTCCTTFIESMS